MTSSGVPSKKLMTPVGGGIAPVVVASFVVAVLGGVAAAASSPPLVIFRIDGCVVHFSGCGGSMEFGTVRLAPLGRTTNVEMGFFFFDEVPPGEYTLTYSPACNPVGCTRTVEVEIVDRDVYAQFLRHVCPGDCSMPDDNVTVDELLSCVNLALGRPAKYCFCDADHSGETTVDDLVRIIDNALTGCR